MSRRNKPYLPLYVQDFLTDEKLIECSAKSTGVYIRIMCILHKTDEYGSILLKQNDKQTDKQINNFALKFVKHLPYQLDVILASLVELLEHKVLFIEGDLLIQKRMFADGQLSETRAASGGKGGKATQSKKAKKPVKKFALAKIEANTDIDTDNESDIVFKKRYGAFDFSYVAENLKLIFFQWLDHKIARNEKYKSAVSLKLCYEKLVKFSEGDPEKAKQIIESALSSNYMGFFELKQINDNGNNPTKTGIGHNSGNLPTKRRGGEATIQRKTYDPADATVH